MFQDTIEYNFNSISSDKDWWTRFKTYNKFVNAAKKIILKVRLEKKLKFFKYLIMNNIVLE